MSVDFPLKTLQLRTHIKPEGVLELSLAEVELEAPGSEEVVVRVEAKRKKAKTKKDRKKKI